MTVLAKVLIESKQAANAVATEYTSPASVKTLIDSFTGTNVTTGFVSLTIYLVPISGSPDATNSITFSKTLAPGEVYTFPEISGQTLEPGDFIAVLASAAASVVIRSSGRQISS
jgi:hypothetical protein